MRIALNHTRLSGRGGAELYLQHFVEYFLNRGHEIHFFGRKKCNFDHPLFHFRPVRCIRFPQWLRIVNFAYKSAGLLEGEDFDISFGLGRTFGQDIHRDSNGAFDTFVSESNGAFRSSRFYRRAVRHLERKLYTDPRLRHTTAVSNFVRDQIRERYQVPEERISVVYNGIDRRYRSMGDRWNVRHSLRKEMGVGPEEPVAVFVGNDWRRKGLEYAVRAVENAKSGWQLWVVGWDAHSRKLRQLVRKRGLVRKVRFVGRRDPLPYYAAADAFLFPTSFDPLSNVTLEAMASGLVVIIGKNDGASELLVDGRDGFVLEDSRNVPEIAGILDKVADPRSRSGFRARARRAVQKFTWERHFERLSCIFDRVLSEKSGGQTGSAKERVFAEA